MDGFQNQWGSMQGRPIIKYNQLNQVQMARILERQVQGQSHN